MDWHEPSSRLRATARVGRSARNPKSALVAQRIVLLRNTITGCDGTEHPQHSRL